MPNYKFLFNRPESSAEDIQKAKDFSQLMRGYQPAHTPRAFRFSWFQALAILLIVVGGSTAAWYAIDRNHNDSKASAITASAVPAAQQPDLPQQEVVKEAFVRPPAPQYDPAYQAFTVKANKGRQWKNPRSNSVITIPAHAFVDENNRPVTGEVEIRYRELHDVVDFWLSGIPMHYDSAGQRYHFESAGMIDIQGFQNDKPVFIAPGKTIHVKMQSNYKGNQYNLYELDTNARNWVFKGKDEVYSSQVEQSVATMKDQLDTTSEIETNYVDLYVDGKIWRFGGKPENGDLLSRKITQVSTVIQKLNVQIAQVEKKLEAIPDLPVAKQGHYKVNLDFFEKDFPELKNFRTFTFGVEPKSNPSFNRKFFDVTWRDVKVEKTQYDTLLQFILTANASAFTDKEPRRSKELRETESDAVAKQPQVQSITFTAYPILPDSLAGEKAELSFQLDQYQKERTARIEEEKKLKEERENRLATELRRIADQQAQVVAQNQARNQIYRVFSISNFGIYNCDRPAMMPDGGQLVATFQFKESDQTFTSNFILADASRNRVINYYGAGHTVSQFRYDPGRTNYIFAFDGKGNLLLFRPEAFREVPRKGSYTFQMATIEKKFESPEEMKVFIGL